MNDNKYTFIIIAAVILIFVGIALINKGDGSPVGNWKDTDVVCLPNGHQNLAMHIHSKLSIMVNGVAEEVPANIGIDPSCMAEVHTHEADGVIHLESITNKSFTLSDFFSVWNKEIDRAGHTMRVVVDGKEASDSASVILSDKQQIQITYTFSTSTTATSTQ